MINQTSKIPYHFFASGEFRAFFVCPFEKQYRMGRIVGYLQPDTFVIQKMNDKSPELHIPADKCRIVARRVESLTGYERERWKKILVAQREAVDSGGVVRTFAQVTDFLLSRGVFPFNNNYFAKGQVVDAQGENK